MSFERIDRWAETLGRAVARLLDMAIALIVAALLVIVFSQFIDRNYVDLWRESPEEYVKIGLTWLCFLGIARAFASGEIIRITFLYDALPALLRRVLDILINLVMLALLVVLTWKSWVMVETARFQMILGTNFTLDVPAYALLISFALLVPLVLWRLIRRLAGRPASR